MLHHQHPSHNRAGGLKLKYVSESTAEFVKHRLLTPIQSFCFSKDLVLGPTMCVSNRRVQVMPMSLVQALYLQNQCPREWFKMKMFLHLLAVRAARRQLHTEAASRVNSLELSSKISHFPDHKVVSPPYSMDFPLFLPKPVAISSHLSWQMHWPCKHLSNPEPYLPISVFLLTVVSHNSWCEWVADEGASGRVGESAFGIHLIELSELKRRFNAKT